MSAVDRVGGHAKNIARYVIFVATERDVRHMDLIDEIRDGVAS
jgi:phosphate uptake regulator